MPSVDESSGALPGKGIPLWLDTTPGTDYPALQSDVTVDVAVIGGGIAGITAAALLKETGATVVLLESGRIVQGVTGHTSAKVTSQHNLIYKPLIDTFGEERARLYGEANESAIKTIASLVVNKQIACDFKSTSAYVYADSARASRAIMGEVEAARRLGLPASFTNDIPLPVENFGAIRFNNQAQFHPRKYLLALAKDITGSGSHVFEHTRAIDIQDTPSPSVTTAQGHTVKAGHIIVATHFPVFDRAFYYARMKTKRSYVLASRLKETPPEGVFISSGDSFHSFRSQPYEDGQLFFIGGESHQTGKGGATTVHYLRLAEYARQHFNVEAILYRWSTQDYVTADGVPYVGKLSPGSKRLYVATGFGGWGMTNATAGAGVLRDAIVGRKNAWSDLYNPGRFTLKASLKQATFMMSGLASTLTAAAGSAKGRSSDVEDVGPEEGKVLSLNKKKVAVYRDAGGELHALSAVCPHMGCTVAWNSAEKSWDCPCHGSRFDTMGRVIQTPANKDLTQGSV